MLFELRKLNTDEETIVLQAPIWTALLIGFADGELHQDELDRLKELIQYGNQFKTHYNSK